MDDNVLNAALAGLLHDVGKMEQRAADDPRFPPAGTEREGQPVHAAFTQAFIDGLPERYRPAGRAGVYHHNPQASPAEDKHLSELVALADKLSAGERADVPQETGAFPRQLVTIFDRIGERRKEVASEKLHFLPLRPLALEHEAIFPGAERKKDSRDDYIVLRDFLRAEARRDIPDPQTYVENLLGALQQAAWCVPSAYYHSIPDVSLYDHARMTAALAVCLAGRPAEEIKVLLEAVERGFWGRPEGSDTELLEKPVALLVGGDISGVQDFIYTIASKGAAKTLRGRSFYLQLLTEAALRFVLRELGLPYTNVIYSGGGNFFVLAPAEAKEKLPALRAKLSRILLKHHGAALYLALGYAEIPAMGFKAGELPKHWSAMYKAIQQAKQQRYSELGEEAYELVFAPPKLGGNPDGTCSVCDDDQRPVEEWDEWEGQKRICSLCRSFADEIGKQLPQSHFVALGWNDPQEYPRGKASDALAELGMTFQLLKDARDSVTLPAKRVTLWALDDPKDGKYPSASIPTAHTLRYVTNQVPPETFDDLEAKVAGGFKKLGVIRLDVDDVGILFKDGLAENATLSRLAALSFQLSLFFEGWMKEICAEDGRDALVYTVYTGGDDAFMLGPWDVMPALAQDIASQFGEYTGGHPDLHMSTGMSFIGGKYPIYQAADDAHEALEAAKKVLGKDAFNFLGKSWKWAVFESLRRKSERLEKIVTRENDGGLSGSQSILHQLQQLAEDAEQHTDRKFRHVWGRWMWLGAYQLFRLANLSKGDALKSAISNIKDDLESSNYSDISQWGAAARWIQLKTRKLMKEEPL
ncbi:MAG: type III-A CRISPR-associated protein Cas10/Csm1 [Anaerolineales bacterium]|nr:type III-A CRISPR-associated protein Cas10/Csm1 [Anaerolineales bacterium]